MFEFFTLPGRIFNLEKRMYIMAEVVQQLQDAINEIKTKAANEREQVNSALEKVGNEVTELKGKISELLDNEQVESTDFTQVFTMLDTLSEDIESIYVEPIEVETPELPSEEVPTETEELFPPEEDGQAFV